MTSSALRLVGRYQQTFFDLFAFGAVANAPVEVERRTLGDAPRTACKVKRVSHDGQVRVRIVLPTNSAKSSRSLI